MVKVGDYLQYVGESTACFTCKKFYKVIGLTVKYGNDMAIFMDDSGDTTYANTLISQVNKNWIHIPRNKENIIECW